MSNKVKDEAQLTAIHVYMRQYACLLRELFRHFACISTPDPWSIGMNGFADFRCKQFSCVSMSVFVPCSCPECLFLCLCLCGLHLCVSMCPSVRRVLPACPSVTNSVFVCA